MNKPQTYNHKLNKIERIQEKKMILPSVSLSKKHLQLQSGAASFYVDLRQ